MKRKIVIIDDEEPILKILGRIFAPYYEVFAATDGNSGIELIKKEKPFFVFLDINMPGMSGMKVLEHIKETGIPVMVWMLTGEGNLEVAMKAIDKGANGYLTKPFKIDTILKIVVNAMRDLDNKEKGNESPGKPWRRQCDPPQK